ncbi:MAG TPA: hypothetical protein VF595_09010 [Tepidisphaeraceae bacterium]|jgi:hypothetical protein
MSDNATLNFVTHFHSDELNGLELPVTIFRPDLQAYRHTLTSKSVAVPAGQYVVVVRMPAGQKLQTFVDAHPGETHNVMLTPETADDSPREDWEVQHFLRQPVLAVPSGSRSLLTQRFDMQVDPIHVDPAPPNEFPELRLRWFVGNVLGELRTLATEDVFTPRTFPARVSYAAAAIDAPSICQLLQTGVPPVNVFVPASMGRLPELTILAQDGTPGRPQTARRYLLAVRLANTTADLMLRYLRRGLVEQASAAMESDSLSAEGLLRNKFVDPIAASVGAYALLRFNQLDRLHDWTQNLARWFSFLPDGAALAGEHYARLGRHADALGSFLLLRDRGVPFFADGLAYAINRLRLYTSPNSTGDLFKPEQLAAARDLLDRLRPFAAFGSPDRSVVTYTGLLPNRPDVRPLVNLREPPVLDNE